MRANIVFLIGLITISSVVSLQSTFTSAINSNYELKLKVEKLKKTNIGSVIINLAQLHNDGRFAPLFDAIEKLKQFLADQLVDENSKYSQITAKWQLKVAELEKSSQEAKQAYEAADARLKSELYPNREKYLLTVNELKELLQKYNQNKNDLESKRTAEVAAYKAALADYQAGIEAIKKALPLLKTLKNDQSFLEVNAEQFNALYVEMKQKLGKLRYGLLYTAFVQTLETVLSQKNFTNQVALQKVIDLLVNLSSRLQEGLNKLNVDETNNQKRYDETHASLIDAIKQTAASLVTNEQNLKETLESIANTENTRDVQQAKYNKDVAELAKEQQQYKDRTGVHNALLSQIGSEQETIEEALSVLNKAGITRSS